MNTPTEVLYDEHRIILDALTTLETAAERLDAGAAFADDWWPRIIAWLRDFADHTHHAKEEQLLFPAMERAGVPRAGGPIGVMLQEHVQGRALIQAMESGDAGRRAVNARLYVQLLRAHIDKENGILFPLADAVLAPEAQGALQREFERVTAELGALASIDRAQAALHVLMEALPTTPVAAAR